MCGHALLHLLNVSIFLPCKHTCCTYVCFVCALYVGSGGFKVFHPMVFQRAIESLCLIPEYERSK